MSDPSAAVDHDPFYRKLFRSSLDALLVVRCRDGTVVLANPTADRILSKGRDPLVGSHYSVLFPPIASLSVDELLEQISVHDGVFTQELRDADGHNRAMDLSATMIDLDEQKFIAVTLRDARERAHREAERERLVKELENALAEVRTLSGLLPICAGCKRVREDGGYWTQIETYIRAHSEAEFSHGLCPDCFEEFMNDDKGVESSED